MNTTNGDQPNGTVEGFLTFPHRVRIQVFQMLWPQEREALFAKLRQLRELPREKWEEQQALPLEAPSQDTFLVPVTDDMLVYFTPQPDGTWRVDDLISQEELDGFPPTQPENAPR
jgi:hypothetical protein